MMANGNKRRMAVAGLLLAALTAGLVFYLFRQGNTGSGGASGTAYHATYWDVFDTVTTVTGYADSESAWNEQTEALHADLQRYNQLFDIYNAYDGVNNLYTVNANAGKAPVKVDSAILELLKLAKELYSTTNGQCNVAGGAVLSLWHDARTAGIASPETAALPDTAALQAASAHCNIADVILDEGAGTVYLADPELRLDVGSIAKGWSAEMAARAAETRGLTSALLSAGGNLRAIGQKPDGSSWTAGVENPWPDENGAYHLSDAVAKISLMPSESLVVSGDYERYYTVDGQNYCHLIDPDTLFPARFMNSVAVLCSDSGKADALSTGLFCMSVADGQALVESLPEVEALWMNTDETITYSSGMEGRLIS